MRHGVNGVDLGNDYLQSPTVFVFTWADDGEHLFVEKATTTDDRIANTLSMDLLALLVRFD